MITKELSELLVYSNELSAGVFCLFLVICMHVFLASKISLHGQLAGKMFLKIGRPTMVFATVLLIVLLLALCHVLAIISWAALLRVFEVAHDLVSAILFSGSCYTTLGYMGDTLPIGWRMLAIFIAISGFFSFSISTAVMLGKTSLFRQAWLMYNKDKIVKLLAKYKLDRQDMDL